jgi:hypothetical protein
MPWTVTHNEAENVVLLNTHPMRPEEAMEIARKLAHSAQRVRGFQDAKRRAAEPPPLAPLEVLPNFDVARAAQAVVVTTTPPEAPPAPDMPPRGGASRPAWSDDLR